MRFQICREEEHKITLPQSRALAAAVLARAFWDLDYISHERIIVRSAVDWFRYKEDLDYCFTYRNVAELFDFTPIQEDHLLTAVREAETFLNLTYAFQPVNKVEFARQHGHTHAFRAKVCIGHYG